MNIIVNETIINEIENDTEIKLNIFDFDGTIFNSPIPNPDIWNRNIYGKLMAESTKGGIGWFQHNITLCDKYIKSCTFNENVVAEIIKSTKSDNCITVMLTGRDASFESIIHNILGQKNLVFDEYGFKPVPAKGNARLSTFEYKKNFIRMMLRKYKVDTINLYDDRIHHITAFNDFFKLLEINSVVHTVVPPIVYLDPDVECELVGHLVSDYEFTNKTILEYNNPIYWGVRITDRSRDIILNICNEYIPADWKLYGHHMTMLFGKNENLTVMQYLDKHMSESVSLKITHIGVSSDAIAVRIQCDVPVDNKIPHITVATSQKGKPYDSNNIVNWIDIPDYLMIFGVITQFYH